MTKLKPIEDGFVNITHENEVPHDRGKSSHHESGSEGGPKVLRK